MDALMTSVLILVSGGKPGDQWHPPLRAELIIEQLFYAALLLEKYNNKI
jgi:hypothetical protein